MSDYMLSILIPARNEEWVSHTVEDILKNRRGKTEIIVGLDGAWTAPDTPGIPDHPDVRIVYVSPSRGQRGMTNLLCKLSKAKYVAKCDAHIAFDEGFDVKLMEAMKDHDDWTIAPAMKNLWVFDWECEACGHRVFQNPIPKVCEKCQSDKLKRTMVWLPNPHRPTSTAYLFDTEPHFQYDSVQKRRQTQDVDETMSLQGSFFMLTREKYWELGVCSEEFGSWGSQGIEVAVKTWLSGGKVMTHRLTWYAHLFRTGDFGFPYPNPQSKVSAAKKHARNLFFGNRWPLQKYPLSWLLERFWPVTGWTDEDLKAIKKYDHKVK